MINPILQAACESRYRWVIVTIVTLFFGCALVLPLVDVYFAKRKDKQRLLAELEEAQHAAQTIEGLEQKVGQRVAELEKLDARSMREDRFTSLRNQLVDMARESGCQLRRIDVAAAQSRPWHDRDDPLLGQANKEKAGPETRFRLERWPVMMTVSGSIQKLRTMLQQLHANDNLMHTKSLELYSNSRDRKDATLDLELWYFALVRPS